MYPLVAIEIADLPMKNWWPSRNSWFTHEFHGGFPWFTMEMNQFTRGPLFIDRDGHKVGRPVVVQTYQKHPTDSNGSRSSVIFEKKQHHQTRHHVDWHNPTKKGDRSSYQITPQKKSRYSHSNHDYSVHWDIQTCSEGWGSAATCNQRVRSELEPPESWTKPRLIVFFI